MHEAYAMFLTIVAGLVGLMLTVRFIGQGQKRASGAAKDELLTYLGIRNSDFTDPRLSLWDQIGLVEDTLIKEIHDRAEHGLRVVDNLLTAGAITAAKHAEGREALMRCLKDRDRKTVAPSSLPDLGIESHCDRDAYWAQQQWQQVIDDMRTLRRHALVTFDRAFRRYYKTRR